MRRLLVLLAAAALAGCSSAPAAIPWDANLPDGGRVIYHVDHGLGVCAGLESCPTRIVQTGGLCVTEVYQGGEWRFRESKPCEAAR